MIVNTRPTEIADKTNDLLNELKCDFIHVPFTKIKELEPPASAKILLDKLGNYDAVIFTSQSAVKIWHKICSGKVCECKSHSYNLHRISNSKMLK
jgi:Uroporphyrinogen-III synthase